MPGAVELGKQLGLAFRKQVQAPKLKPSQAQLKALVQDDVDKQQDVEGDVCPTSGAAEESAPRQQETGSGSPSIKADTSNQEEEEEAPKASRLAKGRGTAALSDAAAAKPAANDRPRPRARAPAETKAAPAAKKPESQHAQAAVGRALHGDSNRLSTGAPQLRTGDEIWQLNLQLSKMAEQLADPEDSKPGRRKQKSPKLAEDLQKRWGGTYSQMLDKNFDAMDVEEPPPPKYEPPLFLDDVGVADGDDEQANDPGARPAECARTDSAAQPAAASAPATGRNSSPISPVAAAAPVLARVRKPTTAAAARGVSDRPTTAAVAKKAGAGSVAALVANPLNSVMEGAELARKARKDADAGRDTGPDADGGDGQSEPTLQDEDVQPSSRRGGRKTKAAAVQPAAKAAPQRPAARRTARGAGAAAAAVVASEDVVVEDQGVSDTYDAPLPVSAAQGPSVAANPGSRIRRSHLPTSTAFGSTITKPLPQAAAAAGAAVAAECIDDATVGGEVAVVTTAVKRSRDAGVTADEKLRLNKAIRIEQQNADLRRQYADLDIKYRSLAEQNKQLQAELSAAEKRAANAESERRREANEAAAAQREIEKLKAKLKDRDEMISGLEEEIKQFRNRDAKVLRQAELWQAEYMATASQQFDKMLKGWRS